MRVDVLVEASQWQEIDLAAICARAATPITDVLSLNADYDVALLACDNDRIADLNKAFRDKAKPTNVLSWPSVDLSAERDGDMPDLTQAAGELGDIAIAFETCAQEAAAQHKSLDDHVTHLFIHGILHLLGFDHERPKDADLMEGLETRILAKLGIADPYGN